MRAKYVRISSSYFLIFLTNRKRPGECLGYVIEAREAKAKAVAAAAALTKKKNWGWGTAASHRNGRKGGQHFHQHIVLISKMENMKITMRKIWQKRSLPVLTQEINGQLRIRP